MTQDAAGDVYDLLTELWPSSHETRGKAAFMYQERMSQYGPLAIADAIKSVRLADLDATKPHWKSIIAKLASGATGPQGCEFAAFVKSLRNDKTGDVSDEGVVRGWLMADSPLFKWNPERQAFHWLGPSKRICGSKHPSRDASGRWVAGTVPCVLPWNVCQNGRAIKAFVDEWSRYFKLRDDEPSWLVELLSGDRRIG